MQCSFSEGVELMMGQFVMQTSPDVDEFVVWSNDEGTPLVLGSEAEIRIWLRNQVIVSALEHYDSNVDTRFRVARKLGSDSSMGRGSWGCAPLAFDSAGLVSRDKISEFVKRLFDCEAVDPFSASPLYPEVVALLLPVEDSDGDV